MPPNDASKSRQAPILVVDDDADLRETVIDVLTIDGLAAVGAADGHAALALLRGGMGAALVLLDLRMPGMTGAEVRDAMLAEPALASIPVVLFSADTRADEEAGRVAAVLRKPFELEELRDVVARFARCGDPGAPA